MQKLVEGWTKPIKTGLLEDGAAFSIVDKTFAISLTDKTGENQTLTAGSSGISGSTFAVAVESGDVVATFTPGAEALLASKSPYRVRFHNVTDGWFTPNDSQGEVWNVYKK